MKKFKKLSLQKETIILLSNSEMGGIAGASNPACSDPSQCWSNCDCPLDPGLHSYECIRETWVALSINANTCDPGTACTGTDQVQNSCNGGTCYLEQAGCGNSDWINCTLTVPGHNGC